MSRGRHLAVLPRFLYLRHEKRTRSFRTRWREIRPAPSPRRGEGWGGLGLPMACNPSPDRAVRDRPLPMGEVKQASRKVVQFETIMQSDQPGVQRQANEVLADRLEHCEMR